MELLDIGDVAARSGLLPSALRHYEKSGLITPVSRRGLRRQYAPDVLLQLQLITLGQRAGFSLAELATLFGQAGQPDLPRDVLRQKAAEVDRQIRDLTTLRDTLHHVADCPAPTHLACPSFQRLIAAAGHRAARSAAPGSREPAARRSRDSAADHGPEPRQAATEADARETGRGPAAG